MRRRKTGATTSDIFYVYHLRMTLSPETQDLTATLDRHRGFLLQTTDGLSEEQARRQSTPSALSLASILKHVADTEEQWLDFAERGAEAFTQIYNQDIDSSSIDPDAPDPRFILTDGDTLQALRERVLSVGARTTELLERLSLDTAHPLPEAPWFEPGAAWSVRRVALHMIAEISQHAGHADIIREAIDGARTMG